MIKNQPIREAYDEISQADGGHTRLAVVKLCFVAEETWNRLVSLEKKSELASREPAASSKLSQSSWGSERLRRILKAKQLLLDHVFDRAEKAEVEVKAAHREIDRCLEVIQDFHTIQDRHIYLLEDAAKVLLRTTGNDEFITNIKHAIALAKTPPPEDDDAV